jgi:diguanylate cyclase (GGDEF)-like protein
LLSDLGINDIGKIHSKVDYIYSLLTVFLIFHLRKSKENFARTTNLLLFFSVVTFTSALLFVPQDEFRMIWFFLLVFVAYALGNTKKGIIITIISIVIILISNYFLDLKLSQIAINSSILGIIIGSLLFKFYTNKISDYERTLLEKNAILHTFASTDSLTGTANRRVFTEVFERYFELCQRENKALTLLTLDLDHFKNINDSHGHQVGDMVLIKFSNVIQALLRKSDTFARIGGEEFAILMFNTDIKGALTLAQKIHQQVNAITICCGNEDVSITTSIGISQNTKADISINDIFGRSDNALYEAKRLGRDQTFISA